MEQAESALATPQVSKTPRATPQYQPPARLSASESASLLKQRQTQMQDVMQPQSPPAGAQAAQQAGNPHHILVRSEGTVSTPVHSPVEQPAHTRVAQPVLPPTAQSAQPPAPLQKVSSVAGKVPQLYIDMDATMAELQEKEAQAAQSKLYQVAQDLQEAVNDLHTLKFNYQELVLDETAAVRVRDYAKAAIVKQKQTQLLKNYAAIRRRDYFNDEAPRIMADGTPAPEVSTTAAVRFAVHRPVEFGQQMTITGSIPELGSWNVEKSQIMQWTEGDEWVAHLTLPLGTRFQFKFVIEGPPSEDGEWDGRLWQEGANREVDIPVEPTLKVDVTGSWEPNPQKETVWLCQPLISAEELLAGGTMASMSMSDF